MPEGLWSDGTMILEPETRLLLCHQQALFLGDSHSCCQLWNSRSESWAVHVPGWKRGQASRQYLLPCLACSSRKPQTSLEAASEPSDFLVNCPWECRVSWPQDLAVVYRNVTSSSGVRKTKARQVRSQEKGTLITPHLGYLVQRQKALTWCWPQGGCWGTGGPSPLGKGADRLW